MCVSEGGALALRVPQGKKPRSCGDDQFSEWRGTLWERNHLGVRPRADPGGAFRARDVSAATLSPPRRSLGRVPAQLRVQRSRALDVFAGKEGRQGLRCQGEPWAPSRVSQTPFGARVVFRKLVLSWLFFRKLLKEVFLLFFPRLLHNSALSFPVGCHHSRVSEKWGNFPECHGENGWARRKKQKANPTPSWNPGVR